MGRRQLRLAGKMQKTIQKLRKKTQYLKTHGNTRFHNYMSQKILNRLLKRILEFNPFKNKVITAIGKTEWDVYRWDGGGAADKRTIINQTDIVFLSVDSVDQYDRVRQSLVSQNVNALLLDCSDAHYFTSSTQKDRIGNCFTWIKAEATFDGLKQILFEPETRISVSETNPDKKAPYQVIESVRHERGWNFYRSGDKIRIISQPYHPSRSIKAQLGKFLLCCDYSHKHSDSCGH